MKPMRVARLAAALRAPARLLRLWRVLLLALFYLKELTVANLRIAADVIAPRLLAQPAIIAVPLEEGESDLEITLLANLITLTPGSTAVDLSPDRKTLYVHVMYPVKGDLEATRRAIKEGFERRILEVTR